VRLPNGVFNPYASIKTNLLFFTKSEPTKEIWYFEHPLPKGYKTYNKTKPISIEEFNLEKAWWEDREENQYAWRVSIEEIEKRNYNLDIKNPHQAENNIGDPKKLLADYRQLLTEIVDVRTSLKNELMDALNREM
jgi:type I restriction enzyme M protein